METRITVYRASGCFLFIFFFSPLFQRYIVVFLSSILLKSILRRCFQLKGIVLYCSQMPGCQSIANIFQNQQQQRQRKHLNEWVCANEQSKKNGHKSMRRLILSSDISESLNWHALIHRMFFCYTVAISMSLAHWTYRPRTHAHAIALNVMRHIDATSNHWRNWLFSPVRSCFQL